MVKRTRIILSIALGIIVIFFGAAFTLAKTGIINFGIFAAVDRSATLKIEIQDLNGQPFQNSVGSQAFYSSILDSRATSESQVVDGKVKNIVTLTRLRVSAKYTLNFDVTATGCSSTGEFQTGATGTTKTGIQKIGCSPAAQVYNITGYIKDSVTQNGIKGAIARLVGGSVSQPANNLGQYTISNIPFSTASDIATHRFEFSASGYQSKGNLTLKQVAGISDLNAIGNGDIVGGIATLLVKTTGTITPPLASDVFTFSGTVRSSGNSIIKNATVKIFTNRNQTNPLTQTTDENGIFTFKDYPIIYPNNDSTQRSLGGLYTIQVSAQGFLSLVANKSLKDFGITEVGKGKSYTLAPDIKLVKDPNHVFIYGFVRNKDTGVLIAGANIAGQVGTETGPPTVSTNSIDTNINSTMPGDYNYIVTLQTSVVAGKRVMVYLPSAPTGYDNVPGGVLTVVDANNNTLRFDFDLPSKVPTIASFSGTVKNETGALVDGVKVGFTSQGRSYQAITTLGAFSISNPPKTKVNIKFENLQGYASIKGGNPQEVDLATITYKDFVLTRGTTVTPATTKIYGTVYTNKSTSPVGGLKIEFKQTNNTLITTAVSDNKLKAGDGITQEHNYSVDVPKIKIKIKIAAFPDGYQIYNKGVVEWTVDCTSGNIQRQNIILEQMRSDNITIVGAIKQSNPPKNWAKNNPETFIDKADISIYTLNNDNTITTTKGKSLELKQTVSLASGVGNIKIENVPRSKLGKYVIDYRKDSGRYQGERIAYNNNLIDLKNNIYQIPSDVQLTQLSLINWIRYKGSGIFRIIGGVLNIRQLLNMF